MNSESDRARIAVEYKLRRAGSLSDTARINRMAYELRKHLEIREVTAKNDEGEPVL